MGNLKLKIVFDMSAGVTPYSPEAQAVLDNINLLSQVDASRKVVQECIYNLTAIVLEHCVEEKQLNTENVLVPVLRAGMAMHGAANQYFENAETSFPICHKHKGSAEVEMIWTDDRQLDDKRVIILDPIVATGDTIVKVCNEAIERGASPEKIDILSCYSVPTALDRLSSLKLANQYVACAAVGVTESGYLIPPTNGDLGDKLYGVKETRSLSK